MNILLTGSTGFLGKIILRHLSKSNRIWGLSRNGSDYNYLLEKHVPQFNLQFDLVIHAAGKAHSWSKEPQDKSEFHDVNVLGTQNLMEGLVKSGIPKNFVFISSVSVYGIDCGSCIDENTPLGAKDPYGISKINAEQIVVDWCKQHGVVWTILRLPLVAGPCPPGNLGVMLSSIKKGYYFDIAGGSAKKSIVLAEDVANIIIQAAEIGGIYNLTDGFHPSFAELSEYLSVKVGNRKPISIPMWMARIISIIGDLLGSRAPLNTDKLKKITSDLTFDDSKAREVFGWNPKPVLVGFNIN
jgi:nucleoside-diphosphate-sugar epimerase